jgi:hypothetical protein
MNILRGVVRGLVGLFVDDGWLAVEIVVVFVLATISATLIPGAPLLTGGILILGCLGVLLANVARAGSPPRPRQ